MATTYDTAIASAARKRKLAEMLEAQSFKPNEIGLNVPGARMSWASALAPLLQGYASKKQGEAADAEEAAAQKAAQEGLSAALLKGPERGDLPGSPIAQEAVAPPSGPPGLPPSVAAPGDTSNPFAAPTPDPDNPMAALLKGPAPAPSLKELGPQQLVPEGPPPELGQPGPQPGPPMLPKMSEFDPSKKTVVDKPTLPRDMSFPGMIPKTVTDPIKGGAEPTAQALMQFAGGLNQFGPEGKDMAKMYAHAGLAGMTPMTPYQTAELAFKSKDHALALQARSDDLAARLRSERLTADEKIRLGREHQQVLTALANYKMQGGGGGGGSEHPAGALVPLNKMSDNGNELMRAKNGNIYEVIDGEASKTPYKGGTTSSTQMTAGLKDASKSQNSISDMQSIADAVEKDPAIYAKLGAVASYVPDVAGLQQWAGDLNDTQMGVRRKVAAFTGDVKHSMYGSALSTTEQADAEKHLIKASDDAATVLQKLRGRIQLEQAHYAKLPESTKNLYLKQHGGTPAGGGKTTEKDLLNMYPDPNKK